MRNRRLVARTIAVLAFWILVWWGIAIILNKEVLVVSPVQVAKRLFFLLQTAQFYRIIGSSVLRIVTGFFVAVLSGTLLGILTARIRLLDGLISPLLSIVKATPVASFIILALVWINKEALPSFISFLMVLPIIHGNVCTGIKNTPRELIEMTQVYCVSPIQKLRRLYLPAVLPYFTAGFETSLGLAWKAGVAAEVLSFPKYAIGTQLYQAKTYLETLDIFAWTVTIVILSVIIEKGLMWVMKKLSAGRRISG